jgi:DNA-binding NarL/FixJ family response regulator
MMANTPPDKASQARLGRREIAVLKLIAQGQNSSEIAKALHIATGTVEVHRSKTSWKNLTCTASPN